MSVTIITGGKAPPYHLVKEILEKSEFIITADSGLDLCRKWSVEPDLILGDMDSIQDRNVLSSYPSEKISEFSSAKDFSDTELALVEGMKHQGDITLIGGGEGRLDHSLAIVELFSRYSQPMHWVTAREEIFRIRGNQSLRGYKGRKVSLFPIGRKAFHCKTIGFMWELNRDVLKKLNFSLSNEIMEDKAELEVFQGEALLMFPFSNEF